MTGREQWGLRGRVRSCRLERVWYSRQCGADACETEKRVDITLLDFRADGALARHLHQNTDGTEWNTTHEYDGAGRLITVRSGSADGVTSLQRYEYDKAGRLWRVLARNRDSDERMVESYEYDASGRKRKTLYVDVAAQRPEMHHYWGVEGTDSTYSAPGAARLTTLYNERGQPEKLLFHDLTGRQLSQVEFRYDGAGRLIEEAQTNSEEALPPGMLALFNPAQLRTVRALMGAGEDPLRRTHAYDGQGRRVETRSDTGPLGFDRKTATYNEQGDPLVETYEHTGREYAIDDGGQMADSPTQESVNRTEAHFHYEYDSQRNWVSKTVESRAASQQEFTLSTVEQRTITYFA